MRDPPAGKVRAKPRVEDAFKHGTPFIVELATAAKPLDLTALFGNDRPVAFEIGPGGGEFLVGMTELCPQTNFLAIEYKKYRVAKIAKKLERLGLTNARLIWAEAGGILTDFLAPGSLSALYINFPDPGPKRRHHRRRLVQKPFVETVATVLKVGGEITFVTDFREYALQALELFEGHGGFENVFGAGQYRDRIEGYLPTVFEMRFREQGLPIHAMRFRRTGGRA